MMDWMWGINLSRALMHAIYSGGNRKMMSIGRVQGPTLAILAVQGEGDQGTSSRRTTGRCS